GVQRRAAIIREGTPHRRTGAPPDCGFRITPARGTPFEGGPPPDTLLSVFFSMSVPPGGGVCGFLGGMAVTRVGGRRGGSTGDGAANGALPLRDHSGHGHS